MQLPNSQEGVEMATWELNLRAEAQHLATSHRGRDALHRVLEWLEESGLSLDRRNQGAIMSLLTAAWGGHAGTVRDIMHEVLGDYS